jgi:hypothetical protein
MHGMPGDVRTLCLPYCLKKQSDGRWILLNRRYKPLGFDVSEWVNYDDFPIAHKLRLTRKIAAQLSYDGQGARRYPAFDGTGKDCEMIFLYVDASAPGRGAACMQAYLRRLAVLANVKAVA